MRTREEQVAELVDALKKPVCRPDYSVNILKMWLETHIREAEERARAECAADTRRLDWLDKIEREETGNIRLYATLRESWVLTTDGDVSRMGDEDTIRATIDAAMEGGND